VSVQRGVEAFALPVAEALKSAIGTHSTATSDAPFDGPANEARLSNDAGAATYRKAFAWVDPSADPDTKAAYAFIHHEVAADGSVGAASTRGSSAGIAVLNGARVGSGTFPWSADRSGIAAHLNGHLRDAGLDALPLKSLEAAMSDMPANAVKFVGPNLIEGPAFLYSADLVRERFTPDSDLCIEWFGKSGRPLLYEHGMDDALKTDLVGRQTDYETRAEGIWAQGELNAHVRYRKSIDELIERGALSYSGGAMQHLAVKSRDGAIKRFPWVELSLTPTPMNPANAGVYFLKSAAALEHLEEAGVDIPSPLKAALEALDEWADTRDDDSLPDGLKFAEHADRLLADVEAFRARAGSIADLRAKSGRVLSASTRERLLRHPASLRELAADLEDLLATADGTKSADLWEQLIEFEAAQARLLGVPVPAGGPS